MASDTQSPHDALFKRTFSDLPTAAAQLRAALPPAVVASLDWDRLALDSPNLVDSDLSSGEIDLLFTVPWTGGGLAGEPAAKVAIIFEHQSSGDPRMAFRMLRYTVRTWERWLRVRTNRGTGRLPLVLPVVLYHGARTWIAPTNLSALVGPANAPP